MSTPNRAPAASRATVAGLSSSWPRSALIVEATFRGHKGTYVRWVAEELLDRGWAVTLGLPRPALGHAGFHEELGPLLPRLQVEVAEGSPLDGETQAPVRLGRELRARLHHWRLFRRLYQATCVRRRPDLVFVPFLDYCLAAFGLLRSPFGTTPWSGILLRPVTELAGVTQGSRWRRLLRTGVWPGVNRAALRLDTALPAFTIEPVELPHDPNQRLPPLIPLKDPVLPPPAPPSAAREQLGIPATAYVILIYGAIRPRKGLRELLNAAAGLDQVHVLCVGEQDQSSRQILAATAGGQLLRDGRLHIVDRFVSGEEQEQVYAAADLVWLVYQGHPSMSGVMMQASVRGIPVLSQADGVMGQVTRRFELGLVADHRQPEDISRQLRRMRQMHWDRDALRRRAEEAFRDHSPKVFGRRIADILEAGLAGPGQASA